MDTLTKSIIETSKLSCKIGKNKILHEIDFSAKAGNLVGVIGANGSGKTTLLRCLAGRIKDISGQIHLEGSNVTSEFAFRAKNISLATKVNRLPPSLTPREIIQIILSAHKQAKLSNEIENIKASLALEEFETRKVAFLSTGVRQRLAILLAFIGNPKVILLDEPFNWVDPAVAYDFKIAVKSFVRSNAVAVIAALHDIGTLVVHCDEGVLLGNGRISKHFSIKDFIKARKNISKFEIETVAELKKTLAN